LILGALPGDEPGRLRRLREADLPELVALRQQVFRFRERESAAETAAYFERIFCRNPWADEDLPSLVYEAEDGRVAGFVGVIPRPMVFRGERIRAAVATQLMVAPASRGLIGRRLGRAFFSGPQDLSLSDTANEAARRIWESVGGSVSALYSLTWTRTLRPGRKLASDLARGLLRRAGLFAARPLITAVDALAARIGGRIERHLPPGSVEALDAETMAASLPDLAGPRGVRPAYEDGSLPWLLAQAGEKQQFGALRRMLVRDPGGEIAGWFLYYHTGGGVGQVLQLASRRATRALVVRHLFHDAWRLGLTAIEGRAEPALVGELAEQGSCIGRAGPWVLIHSPRVELMHAIETGDAFVSRLEGEWWLSF
jgi:hypothetical protein